MLTKLYLWLGHWLMGSLPKKDDTHIKCATCGWESGQINDLKFIYVGDNKMEGLRPRCYHGSIYYKRDCSDLKVDSIDLTFRVIFKGDGL